MNKNNQSPKVKVTPIEKRSLRRVPTSERFRPTPEEAPPLRPNKRIPRSGPIGPSAPEPPPATDEAGQAGGVSQQDSPRPIASFLSIPGKAEGFIFPQPPDTNGAVGSKDIITFTNRLVYAQKRNGDGEGFIDFDSFWDLGDIDASDPRVVWDRNSNRFICCAIANPKSKSSSLLMGVSTTSSAVSDWMVAESLVSDFGEGGYWADFPMLGYSKDKIVVSCNMFTIVDDKIDHAAFWVFDRSAFTDDYALTGSFLTRPVNGGYFPALTLDSDTADVFIARTIDTNAISVYAITGTAAAPKLEARGSVGTVSEWSSAPENNKTFLPQKGTGDKLDARDTRAQSVLYRDGSLYVAHNIFMPAGGSPDRCSVMWWEIAVGSKDATFRQNGIYDDPEGKQFYAYPSIAANWNGDVLVGFSTFGKDQYPSAAYALHAATDPPGELRKIYTYKEGNGYYNAFNSLSGVYRWGDYSSTVVAPTNDDVFWTIQEYALNDVSAAYYHTWSTYWAKIAPPASLGDKYLAWTSRDLHVTVASRTDQKKTLSEISRDGPSICVFNDRLFIAWVGANVLFNDHSLYVSASSDGINFGPRNMLDESSIARPALCVFKDQLYIAWTGTSNSLNLRATSDGINFGPQNMLDETSDAAPALCVFNDRLYIAWRDNKLRLNLMSSADGINFGLKVSLDDRSSSRLALAVFGGKLYVGWTNFAFPTEKNYLNLRASSDGVNFGATNRLDETTSAAPALLAAGDRLYIAWTETDSRLSIKSSPDGTHFSDKELLDEKIIHGPSLALFDQS